MGGEAIDQVIELVKQNAVGAEGLSLDDRRAAMDQTAALFGLPEDIQTEDISLAGRPARVYTPKAGSSDNVLLYFHGGGYVMGSPTSHNHITAHLAQQTGARVVSFDYRLAPEHPFPAAVEDGVAAYKALLDEGTTASRIVIGGDSAGGGLTFATLVKAAESSLPMPAAAFGLSPWTDLTGRSETYKTRADADPMIQPGAITEIGGQYLAGASAEEPLASPLLADLSGLPPLLIQVGDAEILLDDSREFEKKARAAGVDATLEVWDRMIHVWHAFFPMLPEGQEALDRIASFAKERWYEAERSPSI